LRAAPPRQQPQHHLFFQGLVKSKHKADQDLLREAPPAPHPTTRRPREPIARQAADPTRLVKSYVAYRSHVIQGSIKGWLVVLGGGGYSGGGGVTSGRPSLVLGEVVATR
jgi:hypothetical protein